MVEKVIALFLGNAITVIQYTNMTAANFAPTTQLIISLFGAIENSWLYLAIAVALLFIVSLLLLAFILEQLIRTGIIKAETLKMLQLIDSPQGVIQTNYQGLRMVYSSKNPIHNRQRTPGHLISLLIKLTERKWTDERNQRFNQKFINIIESISDGFFSLDSQWCFTYINHQTNQFLQGKKREELINKNIWQEFPETVNSKSYYEFKRSIAQKVNVVFEEFYEPLKKWFEVRAYPSKDGLNVYYCDITERKQIEELSKRYQLVCEYTRDIAFFIQLDGQIIEANKAAINAYGYEREELLSMKIQDLRHPDTHSLLAEQMSQADKEEILFETVHFRKDGSTFPVEVSSRSAIIGNDRILISIIRDLTERKQAELALAESQTRLKLINSISTNISLGMSIDQVIKLAVKQISEYFPYFQVIYATIDNQGDLTTSHSIDPFGRPSTACSIFKINEAPQYFSILNMNQPVIVEDLAQAPHLESLAEIVLASGIHSILNIPLKHSDKLVGLLGFGSRVPRSWSKHEITTLTEIAEYLSLALKQAYTQRKRQQALEALRQSEERFRNLVETTSDWVWEVDENGIYTYVSPKVRQLLGYEPEEIIGKTRFDLMPAEEAFDLANTFGPIAAAQQPFTCLENTNSHKDGHLVVLETNGVPVFDRDGNFRGYRGMDRDITERKRIEDEIRKALEKEKELSELKSRFISMASHEFRTPLSTILSSSDLLNRFGDKLSEEKKQERLNKIQSEVRNMTQLLDDVLIIGKAEAGKIKFNPSFVNLEKFCREILEEVEISSSPLHSFDFSFCGENKKVYPIDEKLLRHILSNLLSNAVKYSPQGCQVDFHIVCEGREANFYVRDRGIGIPPEDISRLFETFHRAKNVGNIPGTGLGLAIIKNAVDLHGGTITVESEVGLGTTFTVCIPINS